MGEAMTAVGRLTELAAKRAKLLDELRVWAELADQGVKSADVVALGWDMAEVPGTVLRAAELAASRGKAAEAFPWYGEWLRECGPARWFNYYVNVDGERVPLAVYVKAAGEGV